VRELLLLGESGFAEDVAGSQNEMGTRRPIWKGKPIKMAGRSFVKREASAQSAKEDSPHGEDSQLGVAGKDYQATALVLPVGGFGGLATSAIESDVVLRRIRFGSAHGCKQA